MTFVTCVPVWCLGHHLCTCGTVAHSPLNTVASLIRKQGKAERKAAAGGGGGGKEKKLKLQKRRVKTWEGIGACCRGASDDGGVDGVCTVDAWIDHSQPVTPNPSYPSTLLHNPPTPSLSSLLPTSTLSYTIHQTDLNALKAWTDPVVDEIIARLPNGAPAVAQTIEALSNVRPVCALHVCMYACRFTARVAC